MAEKLNRRNILVLEQDKAFALLIKHFLWSAGFNPVLAELPSEAREKFDAKLLTFDLLITRTDLGQTSGVEFADRLKEKFDSLKVLYISKKPLEALLVDDQLTIAEEMFLQKPFGHARLKRKVDQLLGIEE